MGELVVEFVRGAQNNTAGRTDADGYLQAGTCCKHVAVYNTEGHAGGPSRMSLNVDVNARDLWETYLPAFQVWHRRPLAEMRRRCRRDADEMQTRCGRDADEMRRRCRRDADEMQTRCGRNADEMRTRCRRDAEMAKL